MPPAPTRAARLVGRAPGSAWRVPEEGPCRPAHAPLHGRSPGAFPVPTPPFAP